MHFAELRNQLSSYLTKEQVEQIARAYELAEKAHRGQNRSGGDPYISHPLKVARILADMHMDHQSIMAAMLHDVIEDTDIGKEQIAEEFGEKVAELVDGVSKLEQIKFQSTAEAQAENLRKMMLAMTKDIRVILIKLADRLHNMRTLDSLSRAKQRRIALETLELYAPIAHRLGMNNFRIEFEDLGFAYLYPMRYKVLKNAVKKSRGNRKVIIDALEESLQERIQSEGIVVEDIVGREKHLYSLYRKMQTKDLALSEIMDVYALRVVVNDIGSCYSVLGIVHGLYKPVYGRFKDYIAVPKANGYQSLHTTVLGPNGVPIEVQIRTKEMNHMAENGIAAHWLYKSQANGNDAELKAREWLQTVLEIQKHAGNSLEFMENVKFDLYPEEVYVFTPSGDILTLPTGATAVDFAYAVHTDVGNYCIAAKIDRRLVPLSTKISSGQTIEIVTAEGAHPNPAWLGFVITSKARSNIRHWLKMQQITESRNLGKRLIEKALVTLSSSLEKMDTESVNKVLLELKLDSIDRLFEEVGLGNQLAPLIARRLIVDLPQQKDDHELIIPLAIKGTEGMVISYASCCRPIPGDPILGVLSAGRGIIVHRESCGNIAGVKKHPDKYVFVQWAENVEGDFQVELKIDVVNKRGVLAILANALSDCEANIDNVNVEEKDSQSISLLFLLRVKSRQHLAKILSRVHSIHLVTRVQRAR